MKLANIQIDILKKDMSRLKDKRIHYAVDRKKDLIFCTSNSIVGYFIKCEDFKIDGAPIINIALNGQELQIHTYEGNKCYVKTTDLNTNSQRAMRELVLMEADLIADLALKGGGENLCDQ